mgnify:CR=1 FL=1
MKTLLLGTLAALIWMVNGALLSGCTSFKEREVRTVRVQADCGEDTIDIYLDKDAGTNETEVTAP